MSKSNVPKLNLHQVVDRATKGAKYFYDENPAEAEKITQLGHAIARKHFGGLTIAQTALIVITMISDWGMTFETVAAEDHDA